MFTNLTRLIRFLYSEWMELFRWHIIRNLLWMYGETQSTNFEEILSTCLKLLSCLVANHTDINFSD